MNGKTYGCPYCNKRFIRNDMVTHLERKHNDELPEGFSPLRVTFHLVNKRPMTYHGACRICKEATDWDEKKGRYNFLCGKKQCHDLWVEKMKTDMGDKMGSNRPTATAEGLQKMLNARKISGKYKWSDGTEFTYTGSYERKTLEFMDQVMEIKSEDITTPGPILEYELDGKKHLYITDIFYIPYNLIIEVKDGGTNPNTNPQMFDTRKRKLAKEKWVIEHTDYNYLRLTNKDFSQLLSAFADLKMNLVEKRDERVIKINEDMATIIGAIPPAVNPDAVYVVNYMQNNVFGGKSKLAVSDSPKFDSLFTISDDELKVFNSSFLRDTRYNTYMVEGHKDRIIQFLESRVNTIVSEQELYKAIFGHGCTSLDQIKYESAASEYPDYYQEIADIEYKIRRYIIGGKQ